MGRYRHLVYSVRRHAAERDSDREPWFMHTSILISSIDAYAAKTLRYVSSLTRAAIWKHDFLLGVRTHHVACCFSSYSWHVSFLVLDYHVSIWDTVLFNDVPRSPNLFVVHKLIGSEILFVKWESVPVYIGLLRSWRVPSFCDLYCTVLTKR